MSLKPYDHQKRFKNHKKLSKVVFFTVSFLVFNFTQIVMFGEISQNRALQTKIAIGIPSIIGFINGATRAYRSTLAQDKDLIDPEWLQPESLLGVVLTFLIPSIAYVRFRQQNLKNEYKSEDKVPLFVYAMHIAVNGTVFVTAIIYHLLGWTIAQVMLLFIFAVINAILFHCIKKVAGYLYIPYIAWLYTASALIITSNMEN